MDIFDLRKCIQKKKKKKGRGGREGGREERRKEAWRKKKNIRTEHTLRATPFSSTPFVLFIRSLPASPLWISPSPYPTREPGSQSSALREPHGIHSAEKHGSHKASLTSFISGWPKVCGGHTPEDAFPCFGNRKGLPACVIGSCPSHAHRRSYR